MLIPPPSANENKIQHRIRLSESVLKEIEAYCAWAGIHFKDYFIEQACLQIFKKDKAWKKNKN